LSIQRHEFSGHELRVSLVYLVGLVHLVYLVYSVYLVCPVGLARAIS
jgi:hypothetical protein